MECHWNNKTYKTTQHAITRDWNEIFKNKKNISGKKHENFNAIHVGIYSMYHFIGNINHVYK